MAKADSSKTIIDLIVTSDDDNISQSGVMDIGLSDHLMTFCTRKITRSQVNQHNTVKLRSMKNYSKAELQRRLTDVNWQGVLNCEDVEGAWNNFKTLFCNILDSIAPLKEVRLKQRSEPWFDDSILCFLTEDSGAIKASNY